MRRWTVFTAALMILSLIFSSGDLLAKTSSDAKHAATQTKTAGKSSSKNSSSSSKTSSAKDKKTSTADKSVGKPAGKSAGKSVSRSERAKESQAKDGQAKTRKKSKKRLASEAPARPAVADLPDSYKGDFGVSTKAAMVMDNETGKILFAQEADQPIPPASLTKVLTLYLINERLERGNLSLDTIVPVSAEAAQAGGSTMRLKAGEAVRLEELIKGIAIASANDGCVAVAEFLGNGSIQPFVDEMNKKAQELGMTNSRFFNPNGLPAEGQVTTARDMAILSQAYLKRFPQSLSIHSMTEFMHNNRVRHNSNTLLGKVEGVDGLKTGFVCASGFNIVVTARRGDTRLVCVVLGARNRGVRAREATRLVEEGFKIVAAEKAMGKQFALHH